MHTANMSKGDRKPWFLREWRKHRGYTQEQFAEMTGLSKPYVSQLERGERQFNQDLLELFAINLRCAPADLLIRDPSDPEGIWSLWDTLAPTERAQAVNVIKAIRGTGTGG